MLVMARNLTLGTLVERLASVRPDRVLVEQAADADGSVAAMRLTYAQAADRVAMLAGGTATEVEPGERVVIATPNSYETLLLVLAASRAGAIAVPVNSRMRPAEIDH